MKKLSVLVLVLAALGSGCVKVREEYTLNPDGSGKVVYQMESPQDAMIQMDSDQEQTPEDKARKMASDILKNAGGVVTWKDVSFGVLDDGNLRFKGTAYFRDLNTLNMTRQGMKGLKPLLKKNEDGSMTVTFEEKDNDMGRGGGDKSEPVDMTEEDAKKKAKVEMGNYNRSRPMFEMMLKDMRVETIFHLPGKIDKKVNIEVNDDGSVTSVFEGKKVLEAVDKLMKDEDLVVKMVMSGKGMKEGPDIDQINKMIYGSSDMPSATVSSPGKPLFDFKAEAKAAGDGYSKMLESLGINTDGVKIAEPVQAGEGLKSISVVGVSWLRNNGDERITLYGQEGYHLTLACEFPGAVLSVDNAVLQKAVADDGTDLVPEREWDRKIHNPRLSDDKTMAVFDVKLKDPGLNMKFLKEVSGTFEYMTASETEKIDAGLVQAKVGAEGRKLGIKVEELEDSEWQEDAQELSIAIDAPMDSIKEVRFEDEDGLPLKTQKRGHSSFNDKTTLDYMVSSKLADKFRIIVECFKNTEKFSVPFKVQNINLLGVQVEQGGS